MIVRILIFILLAIQTGLLIIQIYNINKEKQENNKYWLMRWKALGQWIEDSYKDFQISIPEDIRQQIEKEIKEKERDVDGDDR